MSGFWLHARASAASLLHRPWGAAVVVGGAYLAAAFGGWALSSSGAFTTFWPPNGVLVAALLIARRRLWPYLLFATFPANALFNELTGQRTMVSVAYWTVNVFVALAIAWTLQSLGTDLRFERRRVRSVIQLTLVAIAGTTVGGFLGGLATLMPQPAASLLGFWASWTMADLLAILTLVPLLVTSFDAVRRARPVSRECAAFGGTLALLVLAMAGTLLADWRKDYVFEPLMIPLLGWAALRLGVPGTALAVATTTVLTMANSAYGTGKVLLPDGFTTERAVAFQTVLSALSVTFLGIAAAIADARHAEEELKRNDAARRAYVATMTHEIRNPLGVILGAVQVIDDERDPVLHDRFEPVRAIERAARQILDVAEEMLGSGREALHSPMVVDVFWLPAVWRDLGDACAHVARPAGVELQWKSPAPDVSLTSDRWRLEVVVQNLVMNALEFTERGTVTAECLAADGTVTVVVRHTGIGIAADEQRRIFDLHARGGAAVARPGSGVGLFTVMRFADDLGGTVAVSSAPGRGSELRVALPLVLPRPVGVRDSA